MEKIQNIEDIEVELEKNVNVKFTDNMKFVSSEFGITRNVPLNSVFKTNKFLDKKESEDKQSEQSESKDESKETNETSETKETNETEKDKPEEEKKEEGS